MRIHQTYNFSATEMYVLTPVMYFVKYTCPKIYGIRKTELYVLI